MLYNLSQSKVGKHQGYSNTVSPGMVLWLGHRARLGYARDKFQLQGMWISDWSKVSHLSESQLSDMAGNAWCIASCLPMQLLAMMAVAHLQQRASRSLIVAPSTNVVSGCALDEDDDLEVDWSLAARPHHKRHHVT
jgi:hypothetical protein